MGKFPLADEVLVKKWQYAESARLGTMLELRNAESADRHILGQRERTRGSRSNNLK
jgi:hypothetical protein